MCSAESSHFSDGQARGDGICNFMLFYNILHNSVNYYVESKQLEKDQTELNIQDPMSD